MCGAGVNTGVNTEVNTEVNTDVNTDVNTAVNTGVDSRWILFDIKSPLKKIHPESTPVFTHTLTITCCFCELKLVCMVAPI